MTIDRETVIRFAKKARLPIAWFSDTAIPDLERFAALVLEHERKPLTDEQIELATGAKRGTPMFLVAKGFTVAIEAAHGITNKESSDAE